MNKKLIMAINLNVEMFLEEDGALYAMSMGLKEESGFDKIMTTYENGILSFYSVSELPPGANEEVEVEYTSGCPHSGSSVSGILFCDSLNNKNIDMVIEAFAIIQIYESKFENNDGEDERDMINFYET